jgi:hypothetical protein
MTSTQLTPNLYLLRLSGWQAYLWRDEDGITRWIPDRPSPAMP